MSVEHETIVEELLCEHPTPEEIWKQILFVESRVRTMGGGKAADQLLDIARHLHPPSFAGIVAELVHPQMWPTREHALFLAGRITDAIRIIQKLRDDAEITGSTDAIADADRWLRSVAVKPADPPALLPSDGPQAHDAEDP